jgi:hypothetical protein
MSPEEAHVVRNRLAALRALGESLRKDLAAENRRQPNVEQYRVFAWLGEVEGLVEEHFSHNPVLVARAHELASQASVADSQGAGSEKAEEMPPTSEPFELPAIVAPTSQPPQETPRLDERIAGAVDLLETLDSFVFVEPSSGASDALKALIEQTLMERYFHNWPFRLLIITFGLLVTFFFGGTIYLGWQVQGIANQADAARKSIDSARDSVITETSQTVSRVQNQAHVEAEEELAKLHEMVTGFQQTASQLQTDAQNQEKSLRDAVTDSNKTITSLRDQLTDQFLKAQPQIQGAVTQAIKDAPTVTNAYLESKKTEIDRMISDSVNKQIENATDRIKQDTDTVDLQKKNFSDALEIARNELPQAAKLADTRAAAFTDVLDRYSGRIDDILSRLSSNEKLNTVEVIARVLAVAFWIVLASLFLSLVAIVVSLLRRRPIRQP